MGCKKIAVYPGSFDPVTLGHLDIIRRAAKLFDELVVCVMVNPTKKYLLSEEKRVALLEAVVADLPNVRIDTHGGLMVRYAQENQIGFVIKGLRNGTDYDYEINMEFYNRRIVPEIETVYLASDPTLVHVSSSGVRELIAFEGDVGGLVPDVVEKAIAELKSEA